MPPPIPPPPPLSLPIAPGGKVKIGIIVGGATTGGNVMIGCDATGSMVSATGMKDATGSMVSATGANDATGVWGTTGGKVGFNVGTGAGTGFGVGERTGGRVATTGDGVSTTTGGNVGVTPPIGAQTQSLLIRAGKKGQFSIGMSPKFPADCNVPQSTGGLGGNSKIPPTFVTSLPAPQTAHAS